jgi:hypothetical protein
MYCFPRQTEHSSTSKIPLSQLKNYKAFQPSTELRKARNQDRIKDKETMNVRKKTKKEGIKREDNNKELCTQIRNKKWVWEKGKSNEKHR